MWCIEKVNVWGHCVLDHWILVVTSIVIDGVINDMQLVRLLDYALHVYCVQTITASWLWAHVTRRCYDICKILHNSTDLIILIIAKHPVITFTVITVYAVSHESQCLQSVHKRLSSALKLHTRKQLARFICHWCTVAHKILLLTSLYSFGVNGHKMILSHWLCALCTN